MAVEGAAEGEGEALRKLLSKALATADRSQVIKVQKELRQLSARTDGEAAREASSLADAAFAALTATNGLEAECKELTPYARAYIALSGAHPEYRCVTHKGDSKRTVHTWSAV